MKSCLTSVVEAGAMLAECGVRGALVNIRTVVAVTGEPSIAHTPADIGRPHNWQTSMASLDFYMHIRAIFNAH